MKHRLVRTFRRAFLPALLLLLPVAAFAFATSQAPAEFPTTAPVRASDPQHIIPDDNPASYGNARTNSPDEQSKTLAPAGPAAGSGPVKISVAPAPFLSVTTGDQLIREFIVQNDSAEAVDVTFVMNYTIGWRSNAHKRSVTTSRKIPAHSIQTVTIFVPSYVEQGSESIEIVNPKIFVNGRLFKPLPPGIFNAGELNWHFFTAPSSFSTCEPVAEAIVKELSNAFYPSYRHYGEYQIGISDSDTVQWPAIPQFYQAKGILFRKTTDKFSPDAERAIRDAVMLGAAEFLFVPRGSQRPEWAPAPAIPGMPVVVPRGLGKTVVLDEHYLFNPTPNSGQTPGERRFPVDDEEDDEERSFKPYASPRNADITAAINGNRRMLDYLKEANLCLVNPAEAFQMLPCVAIPNLSFAVVILALLAYIVVVGPVNYFYLVKRGKSILLLLLTVPVISFVFVAIVIVFVTLFEGWFSRASAVGLTFLDQQESMAYTRAAVNLYAPVPVGRLVFDPADTVSFASAKDVNVHLGRDQVVTGANRARIPLVYGVSRAEKRLEQLKVSRNAGNTVSVVNGLGVPVKILAMRTPDGKHWLPPSDVIQPGVSAELKPCTEKEKEYRIPLKYRTISEPGEKGSLLCSVSDDRVSFLYEPPKLDGTAKTATVMPTRENPVEAHEQNASFQLGRDQLFYAAAVSLFEDASGSGAGNLLRNGNHCPFAPKSDSRADKLKQALENAPAEKLSPFSGCISPGMYVAETEQPLFYSPGCTPLSFRARHLVIGTFTLQESAHEN